MKRSFTLIAFLFFFYSVTSQEIAGYVPYENWKFASFKPFYFENLGYVYEVSNKKSFNSLVMLDMDGKKLWEFPLKNNFCSMRKFQQKLVVFHCYEDKSDKSVSGFKTLYAAFIEPSTGNLIKEIPVFKNNTGIDWYVGMQMSRNENFCHLLVTEDSKENSDRGNEKYSILTLNSSMEAKVEPFTSIAMGAEARSIYPISPDEFVITGLFNDKLVTEKFNFRSLSTPVKSVLPSHRKKDKIYYFNTEYSLSQPGKFYVVLSYENDKHNVICVNKIDLYGGKPTQQELVLDESLASVIDEGKERDQRIGKDVWSLIPAGMVITKDDFFLLTQVKKTMASGSGAYSSVGYVDDAIVISSLSDDLKIKKTAVIDRKFHRYINLCGFLSTYLSSNQLNLVYNISDRLASFCGEYAQIDLKTLTVTKRVKIEKKELKRMAPVETMAIAWSKDRLLIPYYNSNVNEKKGEIVFQKVNVTL